MFCPKCKTEYRAGSMTCSDCGADLDTGSHVEPIVLRTYVNTMEAEVAAAALDSVGIESMVRSDDSGKATFAVSPARGVQLLVRPEDVDAANDILNAEGIEGRLAGE